MTQSAIVSNGPILTAFRYPDENAEVMPGVRWGLVNAFPSPAYWTHQVLIRRMTGRSYHYRLGNSLREEVAACLLGGHGIPATVGVAAFKRLQAAGTLDRATDQGEISALLSAPLRVDGRDIRYRFVAQKSRYLSHALEKLSDTEPPLTSGLALRNWLLNLPGIGYKTASWIARNWLNADDVAILDIHLLRAGVLAGFFTKDQKVDRHYLQLEEQFLAFSAAVGVRPSELDAVIWNGMMAATSTVTLLLGGRLNAPKPSARARASKVRSPHADQSGLFEEATYPRFASHSK